MQRREEVVRRLKNMDEMRQQVQQLQRQLDSLEAAMQELTPEERLVTEFMLVHPQKNNVQQLCQMLGIEQASVYRRRGRVLNKLEKVLFGGTEF